MSFRWYNLLGFVMLFAALFLNELVFLNVWYDANFFLIAILVVYLVTALLLSLWAGSDHQET